MSNNRKRTRGRNFIIEPDVTRMAKAQGGKPLSRKLSPRGIGRSKKKLTYYGKLKKRVIRNIPSYKMDPTPIIREMEKSGAFAES